MSSHVLDVSGARALTTTVNDPALTHVFMPAKAGDDVQVSLSSFRELRIELPANARIQRRRYVRNDIVYEHGKPKPNPDEATRGEHAYETTETEYDRIVLVVQSLSGFGRTSLTAEEKATANEEGRTVHESHPSTSIVAKRWTDKHLLESGVLVEEITLDEWSDRVLAIQVDTPDES